MHGALDAARRLSLKEGVVVLALSGAVSAGVMEAMKGGKPRPQPPLPPPSAAVLVMKVLEGARAAAKAWPGFDALARPVLISPAPGGGAVLIGGARAPAGFARQSDFQVPIYYGLAVPLDRELDPAFPLDGLVVTALRGNASPAALASRLVIARFLLGSAGMHPLRVVPAPFQARDLAAAALERRLLALWLRSRQSRYLDDFLAVRFWRRETFSSGRLEDELERANGVPYYAGLEAYAAVDTLDKARDYLASVLSDGVPRARGGDVNAIKGAALCLSLEERSPGAWQERVAAGETPWKALSEGAAWQPAARRRRAAQLIAGAGFRSKEARIQRALDAERRHKEGLLRAFEGQAGRRLLVTAPDAELDCLASTTIPFDDGRVIYAGVKQCTLKSAKMALRLTRARLRRREDVYEFFIDPKAAFLVDGRPWKGGAWRAFDTVSLSGPGVRLDAAAGSIADDKGSIALALAP